MIENIVNIRNAANGFKAQVRAAINQKDMSPALKNWLEQKMHAVDEIVNYADTLDLKQRIESREEELDRLKRELAIREQ